MDIDNRFNDGQPETGAVNMPAYPLFEFKQDNSWTPPGGTEIKFWLRLDTGMKDNQDWVLDGDKAQGILVINTNAGRVELKPGDSTQVPGGKLRYEHLSTWMGYKIFYDPTLHMMFVTAIIGVLGLVAHFWQKFGNWSAVARAPDPNLIHPVEPNEASVKAIHGAAPQGARRETNGRLPRGDVA